MAVPSRIFVGLTIFGLIVSLLMVSVTLLTLGGYEPSPTAPYEVLFPQPETSGSGTKVFLVAASLFCVAFTTLSWRALLAGARRDEAGRRDPASRKKGPAKAREADAPDERAPPPGYQ